MIVTVIIMLVLGTTAFAEESAEENYFKLARKIEQMQERFNKHVIEHDKENHQLWEVNKKLQREVDELTASTCISLLLCSVLLLLAITIAHILFRL